jgi:hypothetical protein
MPGRRRSAPRPMPVDKPPGMAAIATISHYRGRNLYGLPRRRTALVSPLSSADGLRLRVDSALGDPLTTMGREMSASGEIRCRRRGESDGFDKASPA